MNALVGLSHIQELHLSMSDDADGPFPPLQLDRLSGLKKISIDAYIECGHCADTVGELAQAIAQSPELVHLEIHGGNTGKSLHALLSQIPQGIVLGLTHLVLNGLSVRMDSQTLPHLRSLI
jgi:hypothetical protein